MSTESLVEKHPGGRDRTDIAYRAKHTFWYCSVHKRTSESDGELDERFVHHDPNTGNTRDVGRARAFWAVRHRGVDPGRVDPRRGFSLVDAVARDQNLAITREDFYSPYWDLVTPPAPTEAKIDSIIETLLEEEGLYRPTDSDIPLGMIFLKDKTPFKRNRDEPMRVDLMKEITSKGRLSGLALIGALFRESAMRLDFHEADVFQAEFEFCLMNVTDNYGLDREIEHLMGWLAFYRIFSNRWDSVPNDSSRQRALNYLNLKQQKAGLEPIDMKDFRVDALALRYHNASGNHKRRIVRRTPEIEWFTRHREELQKKLDEYDREHPSQPEPYPFISARDVLDKDPIDEELPILDAGSQDDVQPSAS